MFLRLSVFIVRKVEDWTLRILEFQLPVSDHLKLLVGLFDPFFLSANRLSDGGSHLFAGPFLFRCFHIDKKLNVNISVAKIGSFSETTKSFAKKFPACMRRGTIENLKGAKVPLTQCVTQRSPMCMLTPCAWLKVSESEISLRTIPIRKLCSRKQTQKKLTMSKFST